MKYVRTKNGLIEMVDEQDHGRIASLYPFIKKQADTIEELCDEFVCHLKSGGVFIDKELANKFDIYEEVYGAIWTNKGLIYVAKMNEKGELELL